MAKKPLSPFEFLWAITIAHETGDLKRLADFFRHPDAVIGPRERGALAALFDRRKLAKKKGGQKTPLFIKLPDGKSFRFPELSAEVRLSIAADDVRDLQYSAKQRGQRLSQAAAIDAVIPRHPWLKKDAGRRLANYLAGKRGSARRSGYPAEPVSAVDYRGILAQVGVDPDKLTASEVKIASELVRRISQCEAVPSSNKRRPAAMTAWQVFLDAHPDALIR